MNAERHYIQRHHTQQQAPHVTLEKAANGMWTASIRKEGAPPVYLHSRYDPATEADRFAAAQLSSIGEEKPDRIVLYGIGCGHHVKAILDQTERLGCAVEVWETNVPTFLHMHERGVFYGVIDEPKLKLVISDDMEIYSGRAKDWEGSRVHVIVHEPSLRTVPEHLEPLKRVLQDYQVQQNSVIVHRRSLQDNFIENTRRDWTSVSAFRGLPPVPVILISAGPSLAKVLTLLPAAAERCLLGAVGTAASLLFRHGIRPDFVAMTDPQPNMLDQLNGWETGEIPLFFLSTLYSKVVEQYPGPKFILYQEGYEPAEQAASIRGEPLVPTGGSVSTTLFSLARLLGFQPICLVGQDLAYTDSQTHAEGTPLFQRWEGNMTGERVMSFDRQGTVVSPRNLLLYKKWLEEQVRKSGEIVYNATGGGAYIEGFSHVTLDEFLAKVQTNDSSKAREIFHRLARASSMN